MLDQINQFIFIINRLIQRVLNYNSKDYNPGVYLETKTPTKRVKQLITGFIHTGTLEY